MSVRTVCNDSIRLYEGWNLVATPFNFPVEKESLSLINSNSSISLRSYERGWNIVNKMEPWKGYALFVTRENDNNDPIYLLVRPKAAPGRLSKAMGELMALSPEEWQIRILASAGNVYDNENWLGVKSEADTGYDRFDLAEPPVIGNFVKVAFPHKDWNLPVDDFSSDFRPTGEIDNTWEFSVATNKVKTTVNLNFRFLGNMLDMLNCAKELRDLSSPPSNHLHSLHGDREGQRAISISGAWRLCFKYEDADIFDIELVQYH